jgi:hypothetical protein
MFIETFAKAAFKNELTVNSRARERQNFEKLFLVPQKVLSVYAQGKYCV